MYWEEEFDRQTVMRNLHEINGKIESECCKEDGERNREEILKLYQRQLMMGIRLNTGSRLF